MKTSDERLITIAAVITLTTVLKKQGKKLGGFASHPNTTGRTALFSHLHYALTWPLLKASVLPPRIHHRCP